MYARLLTVQFPELTDEQAELGSKTYGEIVPPGVRDLEGFEEVMLLVDQAGSRIISISLWKDKDCCEAGADNAARLAQAVLQKASLRGDVSVDSFEVPVRAQR